MKYVIFIFLFMTSVVGYSQDKQKDSVKQLNEVVITARAYYNNELGITVRNQLKAEELARFSPIDIAGVINQISGVFMLSGALNTNRITIRGVGARTPYGTDKLRLYMNNIPLTNGSGVSSFETLDLEDLNELTVFKGPKATAFGSNLGGAILVQRDPSTEFGTSLSNAFTVGSYKLIKNKTQVNYRTNKSQLNLNYSLMEREGYRANSEFERNVLRFNYHLTLGAHNALTLLVDQVNYTAHIASSLSLDDFNENPRQAAFTWGAAKGFEKNRYTLVGLNYSHSIKPQLQNNTSIFYSYLDHYEPRPFNILAEFTHSYGVRTVFSGKISPTLTTLNYAIGAEFYQDRYAWRTYENLYRDYPNQGSVEGSQLSDNFERRSQSFLFGTLTYLPVANFQVMVGLNYNKTAYADMDRFTSVPEKVSAKRSFDGILSPSLSLGYQLDKNVKLHANISRGFSNPGLEETLNPDGLLNPDIEQEKGVSYELGLASTWFANSLIFNLDLYQMNIKNLLVAERVGQDQYSGKNAGKTKHRGMELSLQYRGKLGAQWQFNPQISYELTKHNFVDFVNLEEDYSGNPLTGVPENRLNTNLNISHNKGWYLNVNHQFVDEIPLNDANTLHSSSYSVIRGKMGYQVRFSTQLETNFYIGVNNILDQKYASSVLINAVGFGNSQPRYYYPGDGRNVYGGLLIKYAL